MKKKVLSVLLALCLILSIFPAAASAEEATSGKCGDDLTWSYDGQTQTLTITGSGQMVFCEDTASSGDINYGAPWKDLEIKSAMIGEGITNIADEAFYMCTTLTSVSLPSTLTHIGNRAFFCCTGLSEITLPESVTSLGTQIFVCTDLREVDIPSGITTIPDELFKECFELTRVSLPQDITHIGSYAFGDCLNLKDIAIPNRVASMGDYSFYNCRSLEEVCIPAGTHTIGEGAFYSCVSLKTVSINAGVQNIGFSAFSCCSELDGIWVDENNPYYASDASGVLYNKDKTTLISAPGKLSGIYMPAEGLQIIGSNAFVYCENLTALNIPASVTTIGQNSLCACDQLKKVKFCGDAPTFDRQAFYSTNTNVYYPAGNVTWTPDIMLDYFGELNWCAYDPGYDPLSDNLCGLNAVWNYDANENTLTISGSGEMYDCEFVVSCGDLQSASPWYDLEIESVVVEEGITTIGAEAFRELEQLTDVSLAHSVETIKDKAFYGCPILQELIIPQNVTSLSTSAFDSCGNLRKIIFRGNCPYGQEPLTLQSKTDIYYPASGTGWTAYIAGAGASPNINWIPYDPTVTGEIIEKDGLYYYYLNGEIQYGAGLVQLYGDYYYIRSGGYAATSPYWITQTNDLLPQGFYSFGADGKLILGRHGIVEENGKLYYYIGDHLQYGAGLIMWEDNYYYVRSNGQVVTGQYWITNTNGLMEEGLYTFRSDGSMVLKTEGIIEIDGLLYYYKEGEVQYGAGLVVVDGNYYYIRSNGTCATGRYYVTNTNDLLEEGFYNFGEDGVLIW